MLKNESLHQRLECANGRTVVEVHEPCRMIGSALRLHCLLLVQILSRRNAMNEMVQNEPDLPILEAAAALPGAKDGSGIGQFVDEQTLRAWIEDYRAAGHDIEGLETAFEYGVQAEMRFAGLSFVEAEPDLR